VASWPKLWLPGCVNMNDGTNTDCRLQMLQGTNVCPSPSTYSVFITLPERQWIQWSPLSASLFYQTFTRFSAVNIHSLFHRRAVFHFTTFYFPLISLYPILFYFFSCTFVFDLWHAWQQCPSRKVTPLRISLSILCAIHLINTENWGE